MTRAHWMDKLQQRDREIHAAFDNAGAAPLPACRCKRLSQATWIGGVRGDGRCMAVQVCQRCRGYQSLGPSDEAPVAVEVRAAELARTSRGWTPDAIAGAYVRDNWIPGEPFGDALATDEEHAGYLASTIRHHDDEQGAAP